MYFSTRQPERGCLVSTGESWGGALLAGSSHTSATWPPHVVLRVLYLNFPLDHRSVIKSALVLLPLLKRPSKISHDNIGGVTVLSSYK